MITRIIDTIEISPEGKVIVLEMESERRWKGQIEKFKEKYVGALMHYGFFRCFGRRVFRYRMADTASEIRIADPRIIDQGGKSEISNSEITGKGSNRTEPKGKKQTNIRKEVLSKTQARSELD